MSEQDRTERELVVSMVLGQQLAGSTDLDIINEQRRIEFGSTTPIAPVEGDNDWNKPYFLLKERGELRGFGRLHYVQVEYQGEKRDVLGVATIVAFPQGQGYGRVLMAYIRDFILESGLPAVGFCDPKRSDFYHLCGFGIAPHGIEHFRFLDRDNNEVVARFPNSDVLYVDAANSWIGEALAEPGTVITADRPAW